MKRTESIGNIKERVTYLQGLALGLNISLHSAEGKLLIHIIDILDDMVEEINTIQMKQDDLKTYVESMDDDLTDLEEAIYDNTDAENFTDISSNDQEYYAEQE